MLQALLHGKLSRDQQNMEDVLTSNVFGLLRYVPATLGLLPLLSRSKSINGSQPLDWMADLGDTDINSVDYAFWPYLSEGDGKPCEPDLVVRLQLPANRKLLVLIEAKYRSGISSQASASDEPLNDQLARELDNLILTARKEAAEPFLIYLTDSIGFPESDVIESIAEYQEKRPGNLVKTALLALSWREIPEVFDSSDNLILKDLCSLCQRLGLSFFHGMHVPRWQQQRLWRFNPLPHRWIRLDDTTKINWRFNP